MKPILTFVIILLSISVFSQTTISGKIVDKKNLPISGVNIFIEGTYDGATSTEKGDFSFETSATGNQVLVVSFMAFETSKIDIDVANYQNQTIVLKQSINTLDAVVISAGTFRAGDNSKITALKAMDIYTTAGSNANIVAAMQTLPGTQKVGEDGRLFVRGGEADETQTYVDGIRVSQPYDASVSNLPTRNRFSPNLFSGMSFSTGGYSAEYGSALSSVLLMNSINEPAEEITNISIMTLGLGLGKTSKFKKSSLSFDANYINLAPYQLIVPQKIDWNKPVQSISGQSVYRYKFNKGLFKLYATYDHTSLDLNQKDINYTDKIRFDLNNDNLYINSSYKGEVGDKLQIQTGFSFGYNKNKIGIVSDKLNNTETAFHYKLKFRESFSNYFKLNFGAEIFNTNFDESYTPTSYSTINYGYKNTQTALFSEGEIMFSEKVALNLGIRGSNASVVDKFVVEPRISFGYKIAKNSQFSVAYGTFNQTAKQDYLKFDSHLNYEKASHYILNYMYNVNGKMLRVETYFKDYSDLIKYDTNTATYNSNYNNNGFGYAKGLDVFWKDNKTVKNLEYAISYSYIDSKRDYKNHTQQVTPSFVASNSVSVVTKYWIDSLKSQLGLTYSYSSGRPYNDPNTASFMAEKTKSFTDLSLGWAYILRPQKIIYISVSNLLGANNIYGYQYANNKNANNIYANQAIVPPAKRFFFVGFFWTISDNKKTNQLNNL
ncbi:Outer membrane cobalamin receptor protein [Flavobacterium swingsii]|uniref:Outer membrane cobalamin receptor protein n=1 Tax=Flavobacterium swingsii TaxID=498292 RepID=A0A1I0V1Z3_9FLAO|nr:TonB-dependent receptor [Flavobacterium swingsii]SFA70369.1 Outer membrane cobalamin receptor protein [Flavobacterium swingsii]